MHYHFPPEAGAMLGADGHASAPAIEAELDRLGLPRQGITIARRGDAAVLEGTVPDADTAERLILAVGNVHGVAEVDNRLHGGKPPGLLDSLGAFAHLPAGSVRVDEARADMDQARIDVGAAFGPAGSLFHILRAGETLETLATRHYGEAREARRLVAANPWLATEGAALQPGLVIRLPRK